MKQIVNIISMAALIMGLITTPALSAFLKHVDAPRIELSQLAAADQADAAKQACCADHATQSGQHGDCPPGSYFLLPVCHQFAFDAPERAVAFAEQLKNSVSPEPVSEPPKTHR